MSTNSSLEDHEHHKDKENERSSANIEKLLNELDSIERDRERDVREIQEIVEDCKERVGIMQKCLEEDDLSQISAVNGDAQSTTLSQDNCGVCAILSRETIMMIGGIGVLLFVLRMNMCSNMLPRIPWFYGLLYRLTVQMHLQYAIMVAFVKGKWFSELCLKKWLKKETYERIEYNLMSWYYRIAVALSIVALVILLIQKCCLKSYKFIVIFTIQVALVVATFLLELRALCYLTPSSSSTMVRVPFHLGPRWSITEMQLINLISIVLLCINMLLTD